MVLSLLVAVERDIIEEENEPLEGVKRYRHHGDSGELQ